MWSTYAKVTILIFLIVNNWTSIKQNIHTSETKLIVENSVLTYETEGWGYQCSNGQGGGGGRAMTIRHFGRVRRVVMWKEEEGEKVNEREIQQKAFDEKRRNIYVVGNRDFACKRSVRLVNHLLYSARCLYMRANHLCNIYNNTIVWYDLFCGFFIRSCNFVSTIAIWNTVFSTSGNSN